MKRKLITKIFAPFSLISIFLLVCFSYYSYSVEREKILYFNDIDGLPRNIVTCIEQDKYGYTWLGTANGISRYNGDVFKNYEQLSGNTLRSLTLDSENNLWVASEQGIYLYNRISDKFELKYEGYVHSLCKYEGSIYFNTIRRILLLEDTGVKEILNSGDIRSFYVNSEGIWYCNGKEGVRLKPFSSKNDTGKRILSGCLISFIREIDGHLFLGGGNGQLYILENKEKVVGVQIQNHHEIHEIVKIDDEYWIATDGNGIIILDENFNYLRSLTRKYSPNSKLQSNSIYDLYLGNNNEIWIATYGAGLGCLMFDYSPFKVIVPELGTPNSLIAKEGVSVFETDNNLYLGTNYGLSVLNEKSGTFINYPSDYFKKNIKGGKVSAINTDSENNFWIGTYDGLLGKYSLDLKFIKSYTPSGNDSSDMQRILFIKKLGDYNLLIASNYRERDLLNFNLQNETFTPITLKLGGTQLGYLNVVSVRKNNAGETVVLLRRHGLFTVNIEKNILENNLPEINNRITFRLLDFYQDKQGFYWMATQKEGLVRMSEDGREFDKWTTKHGLPTNTLLRIESVDDRYLWISTISGLCRFDMETQEVLTFNHGHGLPSNEFTARTSIATQDRRLIFGSYGGFIIVDTKKVTTAVSETEVIISDITFQNQSINNITDRPILSNPLEETKNIVLPFRRNSFTIHFFTKGNDLPKHNNYAYRLIGLEDEWIYLGKTKQTTYTNLPHGNYTFEVKSSDTGNVWNNTPTRMQIEITPPWYLAWYAFAGYVTLLGILLFSGHRIYINRIRLKKEIEMSEYMVQQEHELTERKLVFFTNISHDLKTPLTLIDAPLADLMSSENLNNDQRNKLNVIQRNSSRLYKLISDLLDFRKLTQKQLPLKLRITKIKELFESTCAAFHEECMAKSIDFVRKIESMDDVLVDPRKIEKILWNLLSNAIKFTPKDGEIFLHVEILIVNEKQHLRILVRDTGIGIAVKNKEKIFDRFYQAQDGKNTPEGTGIGLSIVKDMVELHHGNIELQSEQGIGTTFIITLPVEKEYYSEQEMDWSEKKKEIPFSEAQLIELSKEQKKHMKYNLPKMLLVEDNNELLDYLAGHFEKNFKVYKAPDGKKGFQLAKEKNPDIIVTDVMMRNMNGYELCNKIKKQFETSHIPVVILTANSALEQQIEGLKMGADAYITKPFNIKLLNTTIISILGNRKKIRERIMGIPENDEHNNKLTKKDIEFVNELKLCIETNIGNDKLNVELLSEHFTMSKAHLNRKIKSLTGQTPNNLIKSVRLKKAYDLIKNEGLRVSEASNITGFSDPNYFTICFSKEFGKNPSKI